MGDDLEFDEYLYGYPDGTFFAVELSDVPMPHGLEELARAYNVNLAQLPDVPKLRLVVAEALVAGAMADAPNLLRDLAYPNITWQAWDLRELERKHKIAEARVAELSRIIENEIKLRASDCQRTEVIVPRYEPLFGLPPARPWADLEEEEEEEEDDEEVDDELLYTPASRAVRQAMAAIDVARENELPQRLPKGVRRMLNKLPPGKYIFEGDALEPRPDLCAAMTDARVMARKNRHSTVIDWDGEWPVAVRRYGQDGRTVYKVETGLRKHGIEMAKEVA
jgi:hypothetical protein